MLPCCLRASTHPRNATLCAVSLSLSALPSHLVHMQHFGQFSLALFTMIQITSGDGWATEIVRPMHTGARARPRLPRPRYALLRVVRVRGVEQL